MWMNICLWCCILPPASARSSFVSRLLWWLLFSSLQGAAAEANANNMSGFLEKSSRSQLSSPSQNYYSDDDFDLYPPKGKRLAPVGAASNEDEIGVKMAWNQDQIVTSDNNQLEERLKQMEEDQEELNNSLMSLTSHFAKVIFTSRFSQLPTSLA